MRRIHRRAKPKPEKQFKANNQIRAEKVMVVDIDGENRGVMPLAEAIALAENDGLDLVEVNPRAIPPIVKVIDFGHFKYEKDKLAQKQKARVKKTETKMVRLSVRIGEHDFNVRLEQAKKFLLKGSKTKLELRLKGRERQHPKAATDVINRFVATLQDLDTMEVVVDEPLTKQGGKFIIQLINKEKVTNIK